jgi:hypothetical protein
MGNGSFAGMPQMTEGDTHGTLNLTWRIRYLLTQCKTPNISSQGDEATVTPFLPGSRQLEYQEGALLYRDIYFGGAFFVGQETVYEASAPVWAMCYAGGVITSDVSPSEVYAFLQAALRQLTAERPYRGPSQWHEGVFVCTDDSEGDIEWFWGTETITHRGQSVYQLRLGFGHFPRNRIAG